MRALFTSASGMTAQQLNLDVIANNLANVNTAGFKRTSAHFQDLLYQNMKTAGAQGSGGGQLPTGVQIGLGVNVGSTNQIFTQGGFQPSGSDYHMAVDGDGFFRVLLPDGALSYTRDGAFNIDSQGRLVTSDGYPLQPEIIIPQDKIAMNILPDGTVTVVRSGQTTADQVGQISLTRFINPSGLTNTGSNLFRPTPASGDPVDENPGNNGLGRIKHKTLEMPNVEVVEEMIRMIVVQRAYETNSKAIVASDEMLQQANGLKR